MALQSETPLLGEANNNTFEGEHKSEEDDDSKTEEDLEEGEILDSGGEVASDGEDTEVETSPTVKTSPKTSPNKTPMKCDDSTNKSPPDFKEKLDNGDKSSGRRNSKFKPFNYVDPDRVSENEEMSEKKSTKKWYERTYAKRKEARTEKPRVRNHYSSSSEDESKGTKKKKKKSLKVKTRPKKLSESKRKKLIERRRKEPMQVPCKFWQEGHCSKGSVCPFQHMRPMKKKELCRYHIAPGGCVKMRTCPFMHDDFPCKFYHTGAKCFSGENCRFSHQPLTEEMKRVLHDYLRAHHGDDYRHDHRPPQRKRESTPMPDDYDSPPRVPPQKRVCLLGSPPRHVKEAEETRLWQEEMMQLQVEQGEFQIHVSPSRSPPRNHSPPRRSHFYRDTLQQSPAKRSPDIRDTDMRQGNKENKNNFYWKNIQAMIEQKQIDAPQINSETSQQECFENDRGDRTPEYNEDSLEDKDYRTITECAESARSPKEEGGSSPGQPAPVPEQPDPDPIVIPKNLPRVQRELLLRIQKHQKVKSAESDDASKPEDKPETISESVENKEIKEESLEEPEKKLKIDSSDDDDDEPLTVVLQKLNQTPPPKPKPISAPKETALNPNLSQILSNIMQKANPNPTSDKVDQEKSKFWTDIFTMVPPIKIEPTVPSNISPRRNSATEEPTKVPEKPKVDIRDPRLKNRDPRTAPKPEIPTIIPPTILPLDVTTGSHHRDVIVPNQAPAVVVEGFKGNVPYKLHEMPAKPLNYAPYLQASHSDPKLMNDPRLRKRLVLDKNPTEKEKLVVPKPNSTLPDLPLFAQFKVGKPDMAAPMGIQELFGTPEVPAPTAIPEKPKICDPRVKAIENRRLSGNTTPPHPPILEPPAFANHSTKVPVTHVPSSHLPRSIADPRMTKLIRQPSDPRRPRAVSSDSANPKPLKKITLPNSDSEVKDTKGSDIIDLTKEDNDDDKNIKKKAVHRNRKTSMDYASPLNSCNEPSESLNYNSYNKRPKKPIVNDKPAVETVTLGNSPLIQDFSTSDNSTLDVDSFDSLKDVFKTKDPTASPFC